MKVKAKNGENRENSAAESGIRRISGSPGVNGQGLHGKNVGVVLALYQLEFHLDALILVAGKGGGIGDQPLALVGVQERGAIGADERGNRTCLVWRGTLRWFGSVLGQRTRREKNSSGQQNGEEESFHGHLLSERECG